MTGLLLSRDKRLCKQLLSLYKIRVPRFISLPQNKAIRLPKLLHFPLVVKPAFEDSSEGISNASRVDNEEALRERVQFIHERWQQAAIAEEYIEGSELYVGVLGNKRLSVLPIRACHFDFDGNEGPCLATYRVKWNAEYRKKWNITFGFAELDPAIVKNVERVCKRVYRVLQIRVINSVWMQELQFHKPLIIQKLNEFLGDPFVQDLRFVLGGREEGVSPKAEEGRGKKSRELTEEERERIEKEVSRLPDPEMREVLSRVFAKALKTPRERT